MQSDKINPCTHCHHQGFIVCRECGGKILFERAGTCEWCNGAGVEDCPICKNPKEFR